MGLISHVDEISRSVVAGWVVDPDRPNEAVSVSILVDGVHRGMCLTTHARNDVVLPNGTKITGLCAFWFGFDPPLSPFVDLRIDAVETWSARVLTNGTRVLPRPRIQGGDDRALLPILV